MRNLEVWQLALVVTFAIRLLQSEIWRGNAQHKAQDVIFAAKPLTRLLGYIGVLIYSWAVIDQLIAMLHGKPRSLYVVLLATALLLVTRFGWPKAIEIKSAELRQGRALRGPVRIPYSDIASITFDLRTKDTTVYSVTGDMIVHSDMHVDRALFQKTVIQRSGKRLEPITS